MSAPNPYEAAARESKAGKIARSLKTRDVQPETVAGCTPQERLALCEEIGVNPASEETWTLAMAKLRRMHALAIPDDPFLGLP